MYMGREDGFMTEGRSVSFLQGKEALGNTEGKILKSVQTPPEHGRSAPEGRMKSRDQPAW